MPNNAVTKLHCTDFSSRGILIPGVHQHNKKEEGEGEEEEEGEEGEGEEGEEEEEDQNNESLGALLQHCWCLFGNKQT